MAALSAKPRKYRAHERFVVRVAALATVPLRGVEVSGWVLDLGLGGAACELDGPLRLGDRVALALWTDTHQTQVLGVVAWVAWGEATRVRLGIRFEPDSKEAIAGLLSSVGLRAATRS
jgi:hypothetical protein